MGWDIYVVGMKDGKNVVIPAIKVILTLMVFPGRKFCLSVRWCNYTL